MCEYGAITLGIFIGASAMLVGFCIGLFFSQPVEAGKDE